MRGHHAVALAVAVSGCDGGKTALRYHPPRGAALGKDTLLVSSVTETILHLQ
ncbi:MAG TPA: hypothetical protein VEK83_02835 [Gemmatimonadales bacterium]|nr:hypothetical protein [Gemmatimonadales bacterium]